jgi:hypothetical protein
LSKGINELAGDAETAAPPGVSTARSSADEVLASDEEDQRDGGLG